MATTLAILIALGAGLVWIGWSERNTARAKSEFVADFASGNQAVIYCGNGYGLGIFSANDHPWWEWTLVSHESADALATAFTRELGLRGFRLEDGANSGGHTIGGSDGAGLEVEVEVGAEVAPDNCNPDFAQLVGDVDPDSFATTLVAIFRDESRSR